MSVGTEPAGFEHRRLEHSVRQALFGRGGDPTKIGRFTVLRRLGAGGMGVVYSAYDDDLERKVAIKLVREDRTTDDASGERLRREALAVAKLNHPNIVSVFEVGSHDGRLFIAMEFVHGGTVRQWLAEAERSWREIRDVFAQAAQGVAAAHDAGVVHRDLKPDNVMVAETVKVLDFGLAAVTQDWQPQASRSQEEEETETTRLTETGHVLGTPAYMAPEQRRGERVDARSDQYALCLALWEALHGAHPFVTPEGALDHDAAKSNRPIAPRRRGVPSWLDAVVARGMSSDPDERYPSTGALVEALRRDPARRLERLGLVLLGATVVVGVGMFGSRAEVCPPSETRIAKTWDARRQAEVREALARHDPDLSLVRWDGAVARIDEHLVRWAEVYEQTCEAQRTTEDDASLLERRLCLESNLDAVERSIATVEETADLEMLLGDVPSPEACSEDERARELARISAMRRRPAPAGSESGLISDFEDGLTTRFGAGWQWSTDQLAGGESTVELALADEGFQSEHSVRITGEVAAREHGPRWSGGIVFLGDSPMEPVNLGETNAVTFAVRGRPGEYMFMLFTARTTMSPDATTFEVTDEWTTHRVVLDELVRERYDATAIFFGSGDAGTFELLVDDVAIE